MKAKPAVPVRGANPPFFPTHVYETTGARLLDFFAGLAPDVPEWFLPREADPLTRLARWRFSYAEAMLRERTRPH